MNTGFSCGAEGIRTPDPLDAKGHISSVHVVLCLTVLASFPYTARIQSSRVISCHVIVARVSGSVRGQIGVNTPTMI